MAFNYNPKDANNCLPAGKYAASILSATVFKDDGSPLISGKTGEAMQLVTFEVYPNEEGKPRQIRAYFTAKSTLFRYRKLAKALGQSEAFSANKFDAANHIGANLTLDLSVKDSAQYGEQNEIDDFLPSTTTARKPSALPKPEEAKAIADDSIPF